MATILVVDDRPTNRQFLVTLLGYVGHRVVEASDGIEAMEVARAECPELMIVDIVMPRMDGVEFVRQLRHESDFDVAKIMFYTATYRLAEAEKLARKVGVTRLLQKPAQPEEILQAVASALGESAKLGGDEQADLNAVEHRVSHNVSKLESLNIRLTAIIEMALDLTMEGDPKNMLEIACRAVRSICQASYAAVGVLHDDDHSLRLFAWDTADAKSAHVPNPPPPRAGVLAQVVDESRSARLSNDDADLSLFAPPDRPSIDSMLAVPLATHHRTLGWVYLIDKLGDESFTDEDERLLGTLAGFIAMVYENMCVAELERLTSELRQSQKQLQAVNATLERRVAERTTELKDYVSQLKKANAELDQFVYVASHDLQEPLRKLISFSELLEQDVDGELNELATRDLHFITDSAGRMQTLVQDLLALSRAAKSAMHHDSVHLSDCVDGALQALSLRVEETGAEVIRDALPKVVGDETMLTQLYQNLIGNSLKFVTDDRPVLHLTAEQEKDHWVLGVRDNGIGIEPEYAEQIFAPFQRLHGRDKYQGTGIGLAICQKTVERHGGRIWVESQQGLGSHFKFTLPQVVNSQQQDARPNAALAVVGSEN